MSPEPATMERLRAKGVLVQDLAAVAAGLKPLCRGGVPRWDQETIEALGRFSRETGIVFKLYKPRFEASPQPLYLAGRSKASFRAFEAAVVAKRRAETATATERATMRMGVALGYPKCCAMSFAAFEQRPEGGGLVRRALGASPRGSFAMNFIFNLHSRTPGQGELERLLSSGYRDMASYLLPWLPCSLACESSRKYAAALFENLKERAPSLAAELKARLSCRLLVVDDWRFARFQGKTLSKEATLLENSRDGVIADFTS